MAQVDYSWIVSGRLCMRIMTIVVATTLLPSVACTSAETADARMDVDARTAIAAAQRAWSDALVRNDMDSLVSMYTADALLVPPGNEVRGRDAIHQWFT